MELNFKTHYFGCGMYKDSFEMNKQIFLTDKNGEKIYFCDFECLFDWVRLVKRMIGAKRLEQ